MRTTKTWMAGIFGFGLLLAACGTDSDGGAAIVEGDLIGMWTVTSIHEKGTEKTTDTGGTTTTINVDTTTLPATSSIEFKVDHSLVSNLAFPITGTWKLSGANTVTTILSFGGLADTTVMTATISGTQGTFVSHKVETAEFNGVKTELDLTTTTKATKK